MKATRLLEAFEAHGYLEDRKAGAGEESCGTCPFCDKEQHFFINTGQGKGGVFNCKRCDVYGNLDGFLDLVNERNRDRYCKERGCQVVLSRDRGLPLKVFAGWEMGWDGEQYTLGVRDWGGAVVDLRRWKPGSKFWSTPGCRLGLLGAEKVAKKPGKRVWVCEGEWDAMALKWLLDKVGDLDDELVVGVPGASTFKSHWVQGFLGREVFLLYDADQAGLSGMEKAARMLHAAARKIWVVDWPSKCPTGWDVRDWIIKGSIELKTPRACLRALVKNLVPYDPKTFNTQEGSRWAQEWKNGGADSERTEREGSRSRVGVSGRKHTLENDVEQERDSYGQADPQANRRGELPRSGSGSDASVGGRGKGLDAQKADADDADGGSRRGRGILKPVRTKACDPEVLIGAYRRWLQLSDPSTIVVVFGTILANTLLEGSPIWLFLVAPPSGGKSEILMSLKTAQAIVCRSSITPHALVSGMNVGGGKGGGGDGSGRDPSLLPQLNGKVLVVKDFTTTLTMPLMVREEIFGQLRDAYDGQFEKQFGNGVVRKYQSKFGMICGVTPNVDGYTSGSGGLGDKFLKYKMQGVKRETEQAQILKCVAGIDHELEMQEDLKKKAEEFLNWHCSEDRVQNRPKVILNGLVRRKVIALGVLIAYMRGCVPRDAGFGGSGGGWGDVMTAMPYREMGMRLVKQLVKLAMGVALFWGMEVVDDRVYSVVKKVGTSTAPERVQKVLKALWFYSLRRKRGLTAQEIREDGLLGKLSSSTVSKVLGDMRMLSVLRQVKRKGSQGAWWTIRRGIRKLVEVSEIWR